VMVKGTPGFGRLVLWGEGVGGSEGGLPTFQHMFSWRIRRYGTHTNILSGDFGICAVFPRFLKYPSWEWAKAGYAENVAADCAAGSRKREVLKQDRGLAR